MEFFDPRSKPRSGVRARVYTVIFETDTPAGLLFDLVLLGAIMLSVVLVALETVDSIGQRYGSVLITLEWILTLAFTVEYGLRLWAVRDPKHYAFSLLGIVDLVALLPTYMGLFLPHNPRALLIIRALRLLRVFRIFQLGPFVREGSLMIRALRASRYRISVFLGVLLIIVTIQGAVLYFVEGIGAGDDNAFSSIPKAVYWAIVTLTTVGYGDITPQTPIGQMIAATLMLMGYGIIAVPTGIVTAEMVRASDHEEGDETDVLRLCAACKTPEYDIEANYCRKCGATLPVDLDGDGIDDSLQAPIVREHGGATLSGRLPRPAAIPARPAPAEPLETLAPEPEPSPSVEPEAAPEPEQEAAPEPEPEAAPAPEAEPEPEPKVAPPEGDPP